MLRTAQSLPLAGLLTLGFDPARFQTEPPACYRASWQLPGPDSHRQATTSLRTARSPITTSPPVCWAHETSRLAAATGAYLCFEDEAGQALRPPKARTWARRGRIPGGRGVREGLRAGVSCRPDLLQARCAQPVLLPDPRAHRPERRAPVHVRSRLRRPGHRRAQPAPCPADPGSTRMGVHDLAATQNWKIWCDVPNVSANLDNRK